MFVSTTDVIEKYKDAIKHRKILRVKYQHKEDEKIVERRKAPMDYGTRNPQTYEINKDNLYMWCYDHVNKKTGEIEPTLHPVKDYLIISMEETGETFNENELVNEIFQKTDWDYRTKGFAFMPDRDWFQ